MTLTQVGPSVPAKIHLLIVDHQRTLRDALAIRLRAEPDLVVAAEAQSTDSARRVLAGRSTDVILLDAELPEDSSVTFCAEMTRRLPAPCVVMLSAASEAQRIVAAVRAGAVAWVRKDESISYLLRVIRCVVRGETCLPPAELGQVLRLLVQSARDGFASPVYFECQVAKSRGAGERLPHVYGVMLKRIRDTDRRATREWFIRATEDSGGTQQLQALRSGLTEIERLPAALEAEREAQAAEEVRMAS